MASKVFLNFKENELLRVHGLYLMKVDAQIDLDSHSILARKKTIFYFLAFPETQCEMLLLVKITQNCIFLYSLFFLQSRSIYKNSKSSYSSISLSDSISNGISAARPH